MSFKDDSKPDREVFFTPSGKFAKGHPGLYKGKQLQQDEQSDIPPFDGDFDDAIIYVAETYSGKPRVFVGLLAVVEDLRRNKATEFASYLRQAYANRKQKRETNTVTPGVQIGFLIAACGDCVDAEGKQLLSAEDQGCLGTEARDHAHFLRAAAPTASSACPCIAA